MVCCMRLLVTGGAGFIGSNFVHHVLPHVERLVNLDKLTYAGNPENLLSLQDNPSHIFVQGDICDSELVSKLLVEHSITAIAHFAAESHVDRSIDSPEPFVHTNVVGTLRLLDAARKYWRDLPDAGRDAFRFLHVSTDEVYGSLGSEDPAFSEETPFAPNSPYAASKAGSDHLVRAYYHTYKMPVITTNCSNNYGPRQFPEKLIPLMILNALDGKPLPIYGDGMNVRDWLFVQDHCEAIFLAMTRGRLGETYNIGGLCEMPNIEVIHTICDILDSKKPRADGASYRTQKKFVTDRPGHDRRYAINCTKIQQELGWKPAENFQSGFDKTVGWYLANREWCENITSQKYQRQRLGNI